MNNTIKLFTAIITSLLGLDEIIASSHMIIDRTTPMIKYWALIAGALVTTLIAIQKVIEIRDKLRKKKKEEKPRTYKGRLF
jgi:uncharacterized membrane protein YqgA involved in biofilm formation